MPPFDLDVRDADFRRDPERLRPNTTDAPADAMRLVGAKPAAALASLDARTGHADTRKSRQIGGNSPGCVTEG